MRLFFDMQHPWNSSAIKKGVASLLKKRENISSAHVHFLGNLASVVYSKEKKKSDTSNFWNEIQKVSARSFRKEIV